MTVPCLSKEMYPDSEDADLQRNLFEDPLVQHVSKSGPPLFENKNFVSSAGLDLTWRVDCDAFCPQEWDWAADRIRANIPRGFNRVIPVPSKNRPGTNDNGRELLVRLCDHETTCGNPLVVDDVWTTGDSIIKTLKVNGLWDDSNNCPHAGVNVWVVFARNGSLPHWADALWFYGGVDA